MSPDEAALLRAVAAAPADDLPRLVYADWLEEHGRPIRAEFIRLQCAIARMSNEEAHRNVPLFVRQQELLDEHLPELFSSKWDLLPPLDLKDESLPELLESRADVWPRLEPKFDRGFISRITVDWRSASRFAPLISVLLPLPEVQAAYVDVGGVLGLGLPPIRTDLCSSAIIIPVDYFDPEILNSFHRSPTNTRTVWHRASNITISGCCVGDSGLWMFLNSNSFPALTDLDLSANNLTDAGVIDLINSGLPQRLERLVLGGNPITDQSAFELADRLGNSRLKYLNLRHTNITRFGQDAILRRFPGKVDLF